MHRMKIGLVAAIVLLALTAGLYSVVTAELKDTVTRLIHDFRMSKQFLYQLRSFYRREAYGEAGAGEVQRTWRFQRRFNRILSGTRDREFQKLRTHLISEMVGRKTAEVKLRPAGLVALEWARLVTEV